MKVPDGLKACQVRVGRSKAKKLRGGCKRVSGMTDTDIMEDFVIISNDKVYTRV